MKKKEQKPIFERVTDWLYRVKFVSEYGVSIAPSALPTEFGLDKDKHTFARLFGFYKVVDRNIVMLLPITYKNVSDFLDYCKSEKRKINEGKNAKKKKTVEPNPNLFPTSDNSDIMDDDPSEFMYESADEPQNEPEPTTEKLIYSGPQDMEYHLKAVAEHFNAMALLWSCRKDN